MTPRGTSANFNRWFGRGWLGLGYVFLYVPIVALVVFSFNDSPIPNVWRGFTLKWYAALARDTEMLAGLWLSLKIAFLTACGSVVLGTLTAFALVKYKRFPGRTPFFGGMKFLTVLGLLALPSYGGNADKLGWKLVGFVDQHAWQPPFGHYDAEYAGFVPYAKAAEQES